MPENYAETARLFKAFGDEQRLHILHLLQSGEKCGCDLLETLEISQPTLSHHMKILCENGIVQSRREGKWIYYSIHPEGCQAAKKRLREFTLCCGKSEQGASIPQTTEPEVRND